MYKSPGTAAGILGSYGYLLVLAAIAAKWAVSGRCLPRPWLIGASLMMGFIVVAGIIVAIVQFASGHYVKVCGGSLGG